MSEEQKPDSADWEATLAALQSLVAHYNLEEEAKTSCNLWFVKEGGTIDGWGAEDIETRFRSHSLVFQNAFRQAPYIRTTLDLYTRNGRIHQIGQYTLITLLNGEAEDNYLVLDKAPA